jgi:putative ABC transport system permease protein
VNAILFELIVAWRNVVRQGRRTAIAIVAVTFGVTAFLLAAGFIDWMFYGMREWTIRSQLGHIQVMRPGYLANGTADPSSYLLPGESAELATLNALPEVAAVAPRLSFSGLISRGDATISFIGEGVDPAKERLLSSTLQITRGQNLSETNKRGIILGQGLAANLGAEVGDTVVLMANTAAGGVNAVECSVLGLFATVSKAYDDAALRVPIATARELVKAPGSHVWAILLDSTDQTARVIAALRARYAGQSLEFVPWNALADMYNKTVALFARQVAVLQFIVGAIIVLSISNAMAVNVAERTGEIGTALALGLRRRSVLRSFLLEGSILGIIGGVSGLLLGATLAWLISAIGIPMPPPPGMGRGYTAEIVISGELAFNALLLAFGTALLASLYPAWKASRMPIVDSLRHNR